MARELLGGNGIVSDFLVAKAFCDMEVCLLSVVCRLPPCIRCNVMSACTICWYSNRVWHQLRLRLSSLSPPGHPHLRGHAPSERAGLRARHHRSAPSPLPAAALVPELWRLSCLIPH